MNPRPATSLAYTGPAVGADRHAMRPSAYQSARKATKF